MKKRRNAGFSLVELIIVVVIIGTLVAILAPEYLKYVERSRATVCAANLNTAIKTFRINYIEYPNLSAEELLAVTFRELDAEPAGSGSSFTGLCPSQGVTECTFDQSGGLILTCSKHSAKNASFSESLESLIFNPNKPLFRKTGTSSGQPVYQSLFDYLNTGKTIDSEAPETVNGGITSWTKIITEKFSGSSSLIAEQSWVISKDGGNYSIYITTGGKISSDNIAKTVATIKYTYDAFGRAIGEPQNVDVSVSKHSSGQYAVLAP